MPQPLPRQPLLFPFKGLHEGTGYDFQLEGTTSDAVNVRGYDILQNRLRGGRRAGLSKFNANGPVNQDGAAPIQAMTYASVAGTTGDPAALDTLSPASRPNLSNRYIVPQGFTSVYLSALDGSAVPVTHVGPYSSGTLGKAEVDWSGTTVRDDALLLGAGSSPSVFTEIAFLTPTQLPADTGTYSPRITIDDTATALQTPWNDPVDFVSRMSDNFWNFLHVRLAAYGLGGSALSVTTVEVWAVVAGVATLLHTASGSPLFTIARGAQMRYTDARDTSGFVVISEGISVKFSYDPTSSGSWTAGMDTALAGFRVGAAVTTFAAHQTVSFPGTFTEGTTQSTKIDKLLVATGGDLYTAQRYVVAKAGGVSSPLVTDLGVVQLQPAFGKVFMVDGTNMNYYDLASDTVVAWTGAVTAGSLPGVCPLVCLYRGRIVLAGQVDDPYNWFMSRAGDPFDYDYAPADPDGLEAVAGNNANGGLIGDTITALIPIGDDYLIFGGDHSIYMMEGDPASGGSITLVTDKTGIAFGRAWTSDPQSTLYFWGTDGVYRVTPGSGAKPENMTKMRIDARLRTVDQNTCRIYLEWDSIRDCLLVNVLPLDGTAGRVFVWERRNDAWWEDAYPTIVGPSCLFAFDAAGVDDRALIVGSHDGYLRQIDEQAEGDDGDFISSRVRYPPFLAPQHDAEVVLNSVLPVLAKNSGPVQANIYTGQSAEDCATATAPRVHRTLGHGSRNGIMRGKVRGYAVQLGLIYNGQSRWAVEGMTVGFEASGLPRREIRPES